MATVPFHLIFIIVANGFAGTTSILLLKKSFIFLMKKPKTIWVLNYIWELNQIAVAQLVPIGD